MQFAGSWKQADYLLESADVDVYHKFLDPKSHQQALAIRSCASMPALLSATFNIRDFDTHNLSSTRWAQDVNIRLTDRSFFETFSGIFKEASNLFRLHKWTDDMAFNRDEQCDTCSPTASESKWGRTAKSVMTVEEKHLETADYERKMYSRPDAIIVRLNKAASANQARISIGFNVKSLAHQAIAHLRKGTPGLTPSVC